MRELLVVYLSGRTGTPQRNYEGARAVHLSPFCQSIRRTGSRARTAMVVGTIQLAEAFDPETGVRIGLVCQGPRCMGRWHFHVRTESAASAAQGA